MFSLTYSTPAKGLAGTIYLDKREWSLGLVRDVYGNPWHVWGYANGCVYAVREHEAHPYYTDTSGTIFGFVAQTWEPYRVHRSELIEGGRYGH